MRYPVLLFVLAILSGCASVLSDRVLKTEPSVSFASVRDNPEEANGKLVIVGGSLLGIHQVGGESYLEILERPLDSSLRPIDDDLSGGRFMVRMAGPPDPGVWSIDRRVTLAGRMEGIQMKELGQTTYPYPVFTLEEVHLWPEDGGYYRRPFWSFSVGGGFSF